MLAMEMAQLRWNLPQYFNLATSKTTLAVIFLVEIEGLNTQDTPIDCSELQVKWLELGLLVDCYSFKKKDSATWCLISEFWCFQYEKAIIYIGIYSKIIFFNIKFW